MNKRRIEYIVALAFTLGVIGFDQYNLYNATRFLIERREDKISYAYEILDKNSNLVKRVMNMGQILAAKDYLKEQKAFRCCEN